jgi:hypothetical protein
MSDALVKQINLFLNVQTENEILLLSGTLMIT